jgi:hypothetical protein
MTGKLTIHEDGRTIFVGEVLAIKSFNPDTGEIDWCSDEKMQDEACPKCKDKNICPIWKETTTEKVLLT